MINNGIFSLMHLVQTEHKFIVKQKQSQFFHLLSRRCQTALRTIETESWQLADMENTQQHQPDSLCNKHWSTFNW